MHDADEVAGSDMGAKQGVARLNRSKSGLWQPRKFATKVWQSVP